MIYIYISIYIVNKWWLYIFDMVYVYDIYIYTWNIITIFDIFDIYDICDMFDIGVELHMIILCLYIYIWYMK